MGIFKSLREKSAIIRFLVNAQKTVWYPILFAALSIFSGTNDHTVYLPILYLLCSFVLFSVLFTDDNKVFLTPLLMIFYSLGFDNPPESFASSNGDMLASFDPNAFKKIIVCAVITVGAFIIRLIVDGSVRAAFKRSSLLSWSILGLAAAYILNGIFSPSYSFSNLLYGLFIAFGITAVYFLAHGMLERSTGVLPYACQILVCLSYTVLSQVLIISYRAIQDGRFFVGNPARINRYCFFLSWGVATVIGAVLVLGIPAALYLAKNHKHSWLSFLSAILFFGGAALINTRSALLVGGFILFICIILCCVHGHKKLANLINLLLFVILPAALIFIFALRPEASCDFIEKLINSFKHDRGDSGRIEIWNNGIADFLSAPVFGVGFSDGGFDNEEFNNIFSPMYHCIGIEFLGATGIFGCLAFAFHLVSLATLFFKRFTVNKMMLFMIPAMIIGMSIVDNFFFYLNFQIIYSAFLAIIEKQREVLPASQKS